MIRALVCLATLTAVASAATLHRMRAYPAADSAIVGMSQGPDGLLWLASANGLFRFDGLRYRQIADYPFSSARFIAIGPDGTVWAGGVEGLARLARGGRFQAVLRERIGTASLLSNGGAVITGLADRIVLAPDGSVSSRHSYRVAPANAARPWVGTPHHLSSVFEVLRLSGASPLRPQDLTH
jgi:hypothetical protein